MTAEQTKHILPIRASFPVTGSGDRHRKMKCLNIPFRLRFHRFRVAWAMLCAVGIILVASLLFQKSRTVDTTTFKKSLRVKYVKQVGNTSVACRLPNLNPFHESIIKFVKNLGKLQCKGRSFSNFENNVLRVEGEDIVSAQYRKIGRPSGDDFKVTRSDPVPISNLVERTADEEQSKGMSSELREDKSGNCSFNLLLSFYNMSVIRCQVQ